ncbi:hypothetical protein HA462_02635 [Rhizobium leguminosarum bv. trifolii]|nr:hypothetical protein HA462_02635 [Rhizobium leguminosarum bv. trifolii]
MWVDVSIGYWGVISTLVVMQPLTGNTWLRITERAFGSLFGGLIAAVIILQSPGPIAMATIILPLSAAVIALRAVNYAVFMIVLAPMFMLLSDFIRPADHLVWSRLVNEALGALLGLIATLFIFPSKDADTLSSDFASAVKANMAFAAAVLRRDGNLSAIQRDAGIASGRAEIARERMLLEGNRSARFESLHDVVAALRALCGAATVVDIMQGLDPADDRIAREIRRDLVYASDTARVADVGGFSVYSSHSER